MKACRCNQRSLIVLGAAIIMLAPLFVPSYPLYVLSLCLVNITAVLGVNIVMGFAGQVSLGHAGFAAIGAYATSLLTIHLGVPYWGALAAGGVLAAVAGCAIALPALRLGQLCVAMVTFGFGMTVVLVAQNWMSLTNGPNGLSIAAPRFFKWDLFPETFHFVLAAVVFSVFAFTRNIIDSWQGRAFIAIRENGLAAMVMGIDPNRTKTLAFGIGAMIAGISGGLYAGLAQFVNPDAFLFPVSITYVTMGLLGGMGTIAGAAIGGSMLTILPELLRGTAEYKDLLTGCLLLALLIFLPRGIIGVITRKKVSRTVTDGSLSSPSTVHPNPIQVQVPKVSNPRTGIQLFEASDVHVSFGGLVALDAVDISVQAGQIHGIIGPNGAGKTTIFNVISGLNRTERGQLRFNGRDITNLPVHRRSRLGIARTFQNIELFSKMTVLENVLVGAEAVTSPNFFHMCARTARHHAKEAKLREKAIDLLDFVGLSDYHQHLAGSLAFGHQRLLEIARALASGPRMLLLDEPAAGLTSAELESLMTLIDRIRSDRGISILLIGHTMRLVMGLSDHVSVLSQGRIIAEGTPSSIRQNPIVISAYLGASRADT